MARRARRARKSFRYRFRAQLEALEDRRMLSASVGLASHASGLLETANGDSLDAVVSANGRYVAFLSTATNLVSGKQVAPDVANVYRYDRLTGEVVLVSVNSSGTGGGNARSLGPVISADGNVVAFYSGSTNINPLATGYHQVFARNIANGTTSLVSINMWGDGDGHAQSRYPVISADGKVVAFWSESKFLSPLDTDTEADLYARNLETGMTYLVSVNADGTGSGNGNSANPVLSADGNVIAFESDATNLTPLVDSNNRYDVYARNLLTSSTTLVSVTSAGTASGNGESGGPSISADGKRIAFGSRATNIVPLDTGPEHDVFVRDLAASVTQLASVNSSGTGGSNANDGLDVHISADGNVVVFSSSASNLHPLVTTWATYARNLSTGALSFVRSEGDDFALSADGSVATFQSYSQELSDLDADHEDLDVYVHNFITGETKILSVNSSGTANGDGDSRSPAISADGSVVVFYSYATDLVPVDMNSMGDVFVAPISFSVPELLGDYNRDSTVEMADYVLWRKTMGTVVTPYAGADGSGNGIVGPEDYGVWRAHFGETLAAIGSAPAIGGASDVAVGEKVADGRKISPQLIAVGTDAARPHRGRTAPAKGKATREVASERRGERLLSAVTLLHGMQVDGDEVGTARTPAESGGKDVETVDCALAELGGAELKATRRRDVYARVLKREAP